MKVRDLMKELAKYPLDMQVVVDGYEGGFDDPIIEESYYIEDQGENKEEWWYGRYVESGPGPSSLGLVKVLVIGR